MRLCLCWQAAKQSGQRWQQMAQRLAQLHGGQHTEHPSEHPLAGTAGTSRLQHGDLKGRKAAKRVRNGQN